VRTVKTASEAVGVQIVWSKRGGRRELEHVGSAHDSVELAVLKHVAWQRIHAGQQAFDLDGGTPEAGGVFTITSQRSARLLDALEQAWRRVGFAQVVHDRVFYLLVVARVVEPTSKYDSLRVLGQLGVDRVPAYGTVMNCLDRCQARDYRTRLEGACLEYVGADRLVLCLYDVTTLYWETDKADDFRIPGFSKERRLEPQIIVGLLTDPTGFPLMVRAFEGNKAETTTIVPVLDQFRQAHPQVDVTVVADAGMMSQKNLEALEDAGYRFIIGGRLPVEPPVISLWCSEHPGQQFTDRQVWTTTRGGTKTQPRAWRIWYQYRVERAKRNLHGIDESVAKANKIIAGRASAKKNRFLKATSRGLSIDDELVARARACAGIRSYMTNMPEATSQFVIDTYHQLVNVEASFRMSKHDLKARPAYHRTRQRIEAHLTIVFTACAIGRWIQTTTGLSLRAFLQATRPIQQATITIAGHTITAETPIPPTTQTILTTINKGH